MKTLVATADERSHLLSLISRHIKNRIAIGPCSGCGNDPCTCHLVKK